MRFFFDHDVPDDLSHVLRQLGHDVVFLRDVLPQTASNPEALAYVYAHRLLLITCNRADFVALAQREPHHGIIVLFRRKSRALERAALVRLLAGAGEQGLANNVTFA